MGDGSVTKRQALSDAIFVRLMHQARAAQTTAALGILGLHQVASARAFAQHLATGGDLEPFGHRLLRFNAFRTSHRFAQFSLKRARNISRGARGSKRLFKYFQRAGGGPQKIFRAFIRSLNSSHDTGLVRNELTPSSWALFRSAGSAAVDMITTGSKLKLPSDLYRN